MKRSKCFKNIIKDEKLEITAKDFDIRNGNYSEYAEDNLDIYLPLNDDKAEKLGFENGFNVVCTIPDWIYFYKNYYRDYGDAAEVNNKYFRRDVKKYINESIRIEDDDFNKIEGFDYVKEIVKPLLEDLAREFYNEDDAIIYMEEVLEQLARESHADDY